MIMGKKNSLLQEEAVSCKSANTHIVRVTKHSKMLPTEGVQCPYLEIFKIHLDIVLGNQLCEVLLEQEGRGQMTG